MKLTALQRQAIQMFPDTYINLIEKAVQDMEEGAIFHDSQRIYVVQGKPDKKLLVKMLLFLAIPCVFLVVNVRAIDDSPRPDYFHPLGGLTMQLESYVKEHGPTEGLEADLWFEQKLDHFTPSNTEVFSQRYAMNKAYYGNNSLAFLLISGDMAMIEHFIGYSFMGDEARKWRAATFMLEHRFYGKTIPKGNLEMDSLKYLSSEQALADVANFITQMNIQHGFENPKWIVFGWSYAGSLAAWMRYRYPHLVYAAVASSAPLVANADFSGYFQEVSKALTTVEPKCADPIRDAFSIMSAGMKNKTKRAHYAELFKGRPLCRYNSEWAEFYGTNKKSTGENVTYFTKMDEWEETGA
ncbi:putative serine protease F56F10.1 isoform X1 [Bemisia tabaci]|uniref:putative serine protease F56F10.1 isoform X1 n=2 Tax=Bemisia tabaci TaxID=7038 RepID=UPI003B287081